MNETHQPYIEGDLDLKIMIKPLAKYWKILLPLILIGGIVMGGYNFMKQKNTSSAQIYINDSEFTDQMVSDANKQLVADKLGVPVNNLPDVSIQSAKSNSNIFDIVASTNDLQENIKLENTWANLLVDQAKTKQITQATDEINISYKAFQQASNDLVAFLDKNNLLYLTYSQIEELTGNNIISGDTIIIQPETILPSISSVTLLELSTLVENRMSTKSVYDQIYRTDQTILIGMQNSTDFLLMEQAKTPQISLKSLLVNFLLGALVILILGIVVVFVVEWWKTPSSEEIQKRVQP